MVSVPNANPMDIAMAGLINNDLKHCVTSNALSACECTTPELRQMFASISQEGIRRQEKLSKLMSQKGWYVAPPADQTAMEMLMPQLQAATQGLGAAGAMAAPPVGGVTAPKMV